MHTATRLRWGTLAIIIAVVYLLVGSAAAANLRYPEDMVPAPG